MDRLDAPETLPAPAPQEGTAPTMEQRFGECCAEFAQTLRALQGVSGQAALVLETGGSADEFLGLVQALDCLVIKVGRHSATLGSLGQCADCAGSA